MKIKIAARTDAPETHLHIEIMTQRNDLASLGKDRSVMLLVPGGPGGNHSVYDEIKEEFYKFADLILFDPRGCGFSDPSNPEYCTIAHYIEDIEAIRSYFNLEKFILYGGSYGAMAAVGYATHYSNKLEKLILSGGAPSFKFIEMAKQNLKKLGTAQQIEVGETLFSGTFTGPEQFEQFYKILAPLYIFHHQEEDAVPTTKSKIPYNVEVTNLGFGDFLTKFNFEPYLKNISCQTLIIFGKNDWINDPVNGVLMAEKIPNSTLVLLDECGHFIWRDQKEKYLMEINRFLSIDKKIDGALSSSHDKIRYPRSSRL